jgi:hypothetical protein
MICQVKIQSFIIAFDNENYVHKTNLHSFALIYDENDVYYILPEKIENKDYFKRCMDCVIF